MNFDKTVKDNLARYQAEIHLVKMATIESAENALALEKTVTILISALERYDQRLKKLEEK